MPPPVATGETVAAAARGADDLPPVLFTGSGAGHEQAPRAEAALDAFIAILRSDGRIVAFDSMASQQGALDQALSMSGFDTSGLMDQRQICVIRRVDEISAADTPRLKRLVGASSGGKWWIMSAAAPGWARALPGFFLHVRTGKAQAGGGGLEGAVKGLCLAPATDVPVIAKLADVAPAVASGATLPELVEAFTRFALKLVPPRDAVELAARLDLDLKQNVRPLLLSVLVEDAVRDVEDAAQIPGS